MEAIQRMDECDLVLSVEDGEYIHQHILASLSFWQAQSQSCHAAKVLRWKFRPKHHYMEKIGDFAQRARINPRHVSCFQDESFLGHIRNIAVRTHPSTCLLRIFQRLMLNLGQRFEDTRENAKSALSIGRVVPQRKKTFGAATAQLTVPLTPPRGPAKRKCPARGFFGRWLMDFGKY